MLGLSGAYRIARDPSTTRPFLRLSPCRTLSPYSTPVQRTALLPRLEPLRRFSSSAQRFDNQLSSTFSSSTSRPQQSPPPPPISAFRIVLYSAILLATGFIMAAAPAASTMTGLITPPSDAESLALYTPTTPTATAIESHITSHPLAQSLRSNPAYTEVRPHMKFPPAMRSRSLTAGTLLGDDKLAVLPLVFQDKTSALPSMVSIVHLGSAVCGHPGIVHGGLLATLLDEGLARACFPALPNKIGVTASLKIDYRKPCPAESYVVLRAETTKVEGRKAWVRGWIELLGEGTEEGVKLAEAEALFVEPKGAASMPKIG